MPRKPIKWTEEMVAFLTENYPVKGKMWCADAMDLKEHQIRTKASSLKLASRGISEAWLEERKKHSLRMTGRKRPEQAAVMKKAIHEKGLHIRDGKKISEQRKEWLKNNEHPRGMLGKKHSDETKKRFSETSKQTWINYSDKQRKSKIDKQIRTQHERGHFKNREKSTWKFGERKIGDKLIFFRSRWEANYARVLELQKNDGFIKDWAHEPQRFFGHGEWKGTCYLPDFLVTKNDWSTEYHEVKGWMCERSTAKIKMMRECFPDHLLVVITKREYDIVKNHYSEKIDDWENP